MEAKKTDYQKTETPEPMMSEPPAPQSCPPVADIWRSRQEDLGDVTERD